MQTPLYNRGYDFGATIADAGSVEPETGVWTLADGGLRRIDAVGVTRAVVLVPSERVTMLVASLPVASKTKRSMALPFAIEDELSEPLDAVHCALGAEVAPGRYLAAAVRHDVMSGWLSSLSEPRLSRAILLPDALALPVPEDGEWSVDPHGDRVLVRTAVATGFAVALDQFASVWSAAGKPLCRSADGTLFLDDVPVQARIESSEALASRLGAPALDLRQGRYAVPTRKLPLLARRMAMIVAIGIALHAAVGIVETIALRGIAADREQALRDVLAQKAPGIEVGSDVAAVAAQLMPGGGARKDSTFLPLMLGVSNALAGLPDRPTFQGLTFDGPQGALTLSVEAADLGGLQRVQDALTKAGLAPSAGPASSEAGRSEGKFVITAAGTPAS